MEMNDLLKLTRRSEDSSLQFKRQVDSCDGLAAEMAAMANYRGGQILVGVEDSGAVVGITNEQVRALNGWISSASQQNIKPAILPQTDNVVVGEGRVVVVIQIAQSDTKPHFDKNGIVWIKAGADKSKVGSREEFLRLFQESALVHADEVVVNAAQSDDLDPAKLRHVLTKKYASEDDANAVLSEKPLPALLDSLGMGQRGKPNIAGLLLAGKEPQNRLPAFHVQCISWVGNAPEGVEYRESFNACGTIVEMYDRTMAFLDRQTAKIQAGQGFNSIGQWEIPKEVFTELLVNALIHRDYFISAPIKVWVFDNRVEIASPGVLPNNLTIEKINLGNSNIRNPILASYGNFILPYRGAGTGVRRALKACPGIQLINSQELNAFKCVIPRPLQA